MAKLEETERSMNLEEARELFEKKGRAAVKKKSPKEKVTIYKRIVKRFGEHLVFLKHLPKGEKTKTLSMVILTRLEAMAEEIVYAKKPKYRTPSEVHRAAHYLGLYLIYEHEIASELEGSIFYKYLSLMEPVHLSQQKVDETIMAYLRLSQYNDDGIMTGDETGAFLKKLFSTLSKTEAKIVREKIEKMRSGAAVRDVFFHKEGGGGRKKGKGNPNDYGDFPVQ